ncbi:MAG: aspartate--tRNA(Asn) ligase, partial [Methanobacteriota archaeon]
MAPFRSFSTITAADHGKDVTLAGWVEDVRNLGGIAFLIVRQRDGTFQTTIKKKSNPDLFNLASKVVRESVVAVQGRIDPNPQVRNGWELTATAFDVLSPAAAPLPLPIADKVGADMDTRFDNRPLDLRKP